jgi:EipB-like
MMKPSLERSLRALLCALVCCAALSLGRVRASEAVVLAPHRAIYDLTLTVARGGSGLTAVVGRMAYDLVGSACDGYTQNMRFVTQLTYQSGTTTVADLRSSTWEDGLGKRFRFDSSQYRDEKVSEATAGNANRLGATEDIKVELTKPAKKTVSLPSRVYFPVQHSIALLQAAKAGKLSFRADFYDGSDKGEKIYDTVAALGRAQAPGANRKLPEVAGADPLNGLRTWPVSIAYYEPRSEGLDALPVYEISFLMFENGVSRKLHIDYGDFALRGDLTSITFYEPSKCDAK